MSQPLKTIKVQDSLAIANLLNSIDKCYQRATLKIGRSRHADQQFPVAEKPTVWSRAPKTCTLALGVGLFDLSSGNC